MSYYNCEGYLVLFSTKRLQLQAIIVLLTMQLVVPPGQYMVYKNLFSGRPVVNVNGELHHNHALVDGRAVLAGVAYCE